MSPFLHLQGYNNATRSYTDHPDRTLWNTYTTLLSWHSVQEIYCASVSNIASAVPGTMNVMYTSCLYNTCTSNDNSGDIVKETDVFVSSWKYYHG